MLACVVDQMLIGDSGVKEMACQSSERIAWLTIEFLHDMFAF